MASTYCNLGLFWRDKGNYCKAITYAEKSLALKIKIFDRNYLKLANSYFNLGSILFDNKNYNEAKKTSN